MHPSRAESMLYVIGGASRAGKSLLAERLLHEQSLPYASLDSLMMALARGVPTLGIDPAAPAEAVAEAMWPVVGAFCQNILDANRDYVIEGHAILPSHVDELDRHNRARVRACFLGYAEAEEDPKTAQVRLHREAPNDWMRDLPIETVRTHVARQIEWSKQLRAACEQRPWDYVEVGHDFETDLAWAAQSLTRSGQQRSTRIE